MRTLCSREHKYEGMKGKYEGTKVCTNIKVSYSREQCSLMFAEE